MICPRGIAASDGGIIVDIVKSHNTTQSTKAGEVSISVYAGMRVGVQVNCAGRSVDTVACYSPDLCCDAT